MVAHQSHQRKKLYMVPIEIHFSKSGGLSWQFVVSKGVLYFIDRPFCFVGKEKERFVKDVFVGRVICQGWVVVFDEWVVTFIYEGWVVILIWWEIFWSCRKGGKLELGKSKKNIYIFWRENNYIKNGRKKKVWCKSMWILNSKMGEGVVKKNNNNNKNILKNIIVKQNRESNVVVL